MNAKQEAFAREYAVDRNGKQAAIRAGYSPKSAEVTASKLLRNPKVAALVAELDQRHAAAAEISAEETVCELARVGTASITDAMRWDDDGARLIPSDQLNPAVAAAIAEVTDEVTYAGSSEEDGVILKRRRKIKMHPKTPALVKLAEIHKLLGPLARGQEAETEVPGVIVVPARQSRDAWAKKHGVVEVDEHGNPVDVN